MLNFFIVLYHGLKIVALSTTTYSTLGDDIMSSSPEADVAPEAIVDTLDDEEEDDTDVHYAKVVSSDPLLVACGGGIPEWQNDVLPSTPEAIVSTEAMVAVSTNLATTK